MPIVAIGIAIALAVGPAISLGIITSIAFANLIIGIGLSLALNGAISFVTNLFNKPPNTGSLSMKGRTVNARQSIAPWEIIYGTVRKGGIFTYIGVHGTDNAYLDLVITLAGHEVQSIDTMYFDGTAVPLDGSGNATGNYLGLVHVEKNLGTAGQAAFAGLVAAVPAKWTANHRQRGRAGVYVQLKWDATKFPNGVPGITFDVKGKKVFDPRSSTTAWSVNPVLCRRDYMTDLTYGMRIPTADIDDSLVNAAANVCEEVVTNKDLTTENRYTCNGTFDTSIMHGEVLKALISADVGDIIYTGGKWKTYSGAWRAPAAPVITDADLRGPIQVQARASRRDMFNGVKGVYFSPANNDQRSDFPPVQKAAYVAEDAGEVVWKDITLPFTNSGTMAQRIASIILETVRRQVQVSIPLKLSAYNFTPPDVLQLTYSRFTWATKTFRLADMTLSADRSEDGSPVLGLDLSCQETDAAIYSWNPATDEKTPTPASAAPLPTMEIVAAPTAMAATSGSTTALTRVDGIKISRVKLTWTAPVDQFVVSGGYIEAQYKKSSDSTWTSVEPVTGDSTQMFFIDIDDSVNYDFRIRSVNTIGSRSAWATLSTHNVTGVNSGLVAAGRVTGAIAQDIAENRLWNNWFQGTAAALTGQPAAPTGYGTWADAKTEGTASAFSGEGELNTNVTVTGAGKNGVKNSAKYEYVGIAGESVTLSVQAIWKSGTQPNGNVRLRIVGLDSLGAETGTARVQDTPASEFNASTYKTTVFMTTLPTDTTDLDKWQVEIHNLGSTNEAFKIRRAMLSRSVDQPRWTSAVARDQLAQHVAGGGTGTPGGDPGGPETCPGGGHTCL